MQLFTIPNIITLLNLLCGCLAIVFAFQGNLVWSAYLVGIAAVLDFLDGFVARALKQFSPVGKDLDSLADMVTFGVVPGVVMFHLLNAAMVPLPWADGAFVPGPDLFGSLWVSGNIPTQPLWMKILPYTAFLIPLFSALRLAKFNNDTRQSDSFIGVPTPANSILICSFPLILKIHESSAGAGWTMYPPPTLFDQQVYEVLLNPWFLIGVTIVMSYLLIAELPLFSLKFKNFGWKKNEIRYSFLAASLVLLVLLKYIALPLVIVLYVLLSVVNNLMKRKKVAS